MIRLTSALVLAMLVAACGMGETGQSDTSSDPGPTVSFDEAERVEAACELVLEGLMERNTALIITSLEDLDAAMSTLGREDLRQHAQSASDALPAYGDTPPTEGDLAEAAPGLIALSNGLIAAGMDRGCAGIGEVAGDFDQRIEDETTVQELSAAIERWESTDVATYSLELSLGPMASFEGCGTGGSLLVHVVDNEVTEAVDRLGGCEVDIEASNRVPVTVEDLFALVENNLDARIIQVDFEPQRGYPRSIFIQSDSGHVDISVVNFIPGRAALKTSEDVLAELEEHRQAWRDHNTGSYTMTVEIGCFCPEEYRGPFTVTVISDEISTVTMEGEVVEPIEEKFLTVEGLFATIEAYAHSDEITVTYSPKGHPTNIDIDPSRNTVDEELRIDVRELTVTDP